MIAVPHVRPRVVSAVTLVATSVAAACTPAAPPDTRVQDEASIRVLEAAWSSALQAKDLDRFVANYAPEAVVLPPNEPIATTPDGIRKDLADFLALPGFSMSFRPTAVKVASAGDFAYSYGTYDLTMTGQNGKPVPDKGKYVTVYRKQADGSWKAVVDTFNSDNPPTVTPRLKTTKKK